MSSSQRDYWLILITSLIAIGFGVAFVARHLNAASDGARIVPGEVMADGVMVSPLRNVGLQPGDWVVAVEGRSLEDWAGNLFGRRLPLPAWGLDEVVWYSVVRDGKVMDVPIKLGPYPLWEFSIIPGALSFL
ncbi:MAG: hypothetical protein HC806_00395, partial [Anaerolineae bacterium]|nr:hypothetical protein [Anaerolineae bacterium]